MTRQKRKTIPARAEPIAAPAMPAADEGRALFSVVLDQDTVLIIGTAANPPPETADVRFGDTAARRNAWRALSWKGPEIAHGSGHHFIGLLWAEDIMRLQAARLSLCDGDGTPRLRLADLGRIELEAAPLFAHLRTVGTDLAAAFDFLRQALLTPPVGTPSQRVRRFLLAFLDAISKHDGFIEIIGRPECGGLLLQGWAVHLQPGATDLGLLGANFSIERAVTASFERPDLLAAARGVVAYAKDAPSEDLAGIKRVYFRGSDGYYHVDTIDNRLIHDGAEAVAHLKDMLGKLETDTATMRAFKRVCRVRFPGHETMSSLNAPVRLACDMAIHVDGAGIFVSGWLLDPRQSTALVLLKSTGNFYSRTDETWVRLPRRDVSEGFAQDPLFAGLLRPDDVHHGFLAFVPRTQPLEPGETHYLEIVLDDETCAFSPIRFDPSPPEAAIRHILGSVNTDDPMIESIVEKHLGPIATALSASRESVAAGKSRVPFGTPPKRPDVAVVVPITGPRADFDINLARFAGDSDFQRAELIVVAARRDADDIAKLLKRAATFYGLGGTLVIAESPIDYHEGLELGARAATADLVLFLAPTVLPSGRGWLGRLVAAMRQAPDPGLVSPTLMYEDESVRYAGSTSPPGADPTAATRQFAGYSRHWLKAAELTAVWAGTAECALIPRRLFLNAGGFSRELIGPDLKTLDFSMRLGAQGTRCYWAPDVALYALDEAESSEPNGYWTRVRGLVDRWAFQRKWSTVLTATTVTQ